MIDTTHIPCKHTHYYTIRVNQKCGECGVKKDVKIPKYFKVVYNPKHEETKRINRRINELLGNSSSCRCLRCNPNTGN